MLNEAPYTFFIANPPLGKVPGTKSCQLLARLQAACKIPPSQLKRANVRVFKAITCADVPSFSRDFSIAPLPEAPVSQLTLNLKQEKKHLPKTNQKRPKKLCFPIKTSHFLIFDTAPARVLERGASVFRKKNQLAPRFGLHPGYHHASVHLWYW